MRRSFPRHFVSKAWIIFFLFFRVSRQGPCFTATEENGGNKRLAQLELACEAVVSSHLIYPLTTRVVGAPQTISQPVSSIFPVLHCPLGLGELQACPFPDVVYPPLPLSALSSPPFHCALQDGFGQAWWTWDMTIPLQFASLYDVQEVFVWYICLLDLGTDFLVGNMVLYEMHSILR